MSRTHLSTHVYPPVDVYSVALVFEKTAVLDVTFPSNAAVVPLFVLFLDSRLSLPLWISLLSMYKNTGLVITSQPIEITSVL